MPDQNPALRRFVMLFTVVALALLWVAPVGADGFLYDSVPVSERHRFGVNVWDDPSRYDFEQLYLRWYLNWLVDRDPWLPRGVEYVQQAIVAEGPTTEALNNIEATIEAHPGSWWLIGNEPDHQWAQDHMTPSDYAIRYRQLYVFIKARDETAKVAAGGLVQASPLRVQYLTEVLNAYSSLYGEDLPADGWHFHEQILCESCDWGCGIPLGLKDNYGHLAEYYTTEDAASLAVFTDHVIRMRTWMRDHGFQNVPLILSEFGVLMPSGCGYLGGQNKAIGDQMVKDYMVGTMDFMLSTEDPALGMPGDQNRLVQSWSWYSIDGPMTTADCSYVNSANGSFYDFDAPTVLTQFGNHFMQFMDGQLPGQATYLMDPATTWIQNFGAAAAGGGWTSFEYFPRLLGDVNGDGRADVVGFGNAGTLVSLSTGSGFGGTSLWLNDFGASPAGGGWTSFNSYPRALGDVNGDGRDDIVGFGNAGALVSLSTGTSFQPSQLWVANFGYAPAGGGWTSYDSYPRTLGDMNGDGRDDIVGFGNAGVLVSLSSGSGFGPATLWLGDFGRLPSAGGWVEFDYHPRTVGDVNGDGLADIIGFGNAGVLVSLGTGSSIAGSNLWLNNFGATPEAGGWVSYNDHPRAIADVDGDGLGDIVGFGNNGTLVLFSSGYGFIGDYSGINNFGKLPVGGGWASFGQYPRWAADVSGDGKADAVGFGGGGTLVSVTK